MLRMFLTKPSCPYFGENQPDGSSSRSLKMKVWQPITALCLEDTGPGVFPEGCRYTLGVTQKNSSLWSCQQLKIRYISGQLA